MHKPHEWATGPGNNPLLCEIDPISMGAAALGGLVPMLFGGGNKKADAAPAQAPAAPPPAPPPESAPMGSKKQPASTSSFIGAVPTPPQSTGSKTLLGQ